MAKMFARGNGNTDYVPSNGYMLPDYDYTFDNALECAKSIVESTIIRNSDMRPSGLRYIDFTDGNFAFVAFKDSISIWLNGWEQKFHITNW
jgi:hypothetical protein